MSEPLQSAAYLIAALGLVTLTWLSLRDNARIRQARRALFENAKQALETPEITHGADDLPRLRGRFRDRKVVADLIPDTLTIRRLPQLWLSVTLLEKQNNIEGFAMLVRHAGTEFYSLTNSFAERLDAPVGFPNEILIRGQSEASQGLIDALAQPLAAILADPRVKEIAVTPKGLRIVRQAAEGRRGEHLLLRQAMFDDAGVPAADLQRILYALDGLSTAIKPLAGERAA